MANDKKKKIKIPDSVLDLRLSPKKFAKKHNIKIKGKNLSKSDKKHNIKRLKREYSKAAITGLDRAVKILAENPDAKKIDKVKEGVENIIINPPVMRKVAKLYKKNPDEYQNMIFLPKMIMNTVLYYSSDSISESEKEIGKDLDKDGLVTFCEKILKKQVKKYRNLGLDDDAAFRMACTIPTARLFKNNRHWYRQMINEMYAIAETIEMDIDTVLKAALNIDKKKSISKKDFYEEFYSEFILTKNSNKNLKFSESQKELHESLIEKTLSYLDGLKPRKLREILKQYIKRRKSAENYKSDYKRVIKFTDHANSNSPYDTIKKVVQDLIKENSSNELYLS